MGKYRQVQGEYISQVREHLVAIAGPRAADQVWVLLVVVSGQVTTTEFRPLSEASDPAYTPDGETPIGRALDVMADKCEAFFEKQVFPNETTVKAFETVVFSDLHATGETVEQTDAGVKKFLATAKKFNGKVTVVSPDHESTNHDLARRLDVNERGVRFLNSDPKAILQVTFDSVVNASRKLSGSRPLPAGR